MAFGGSNGQPEMNVTPMIDILLVLIIAFMIIVPTGQKGLTADIPQEATKESPQKTETAIVIELHGDGCHTYDEKSHAKDCRPDLTINQQPVKWEELQARLLNIFKQRARRVAFVKADNDLEFDNVAQVIDIAHAAGVDNVGLMDSH
jgi:biopolymer transport protein ExbD